MKPTKLAARGAFLLVCIGVAMVAFAQEKKAPAIKEAAGGDVGELRLRNMAPITYVYVEMESSFDKIGQSIQEAMPKITKAAQDGKFRLTGPFIMTYPNGVAHMTPDKPFKVQIGLKAEGEAAASGDAKVRTTEEFRAATTLYAGPPSGVGAAYEKLMPAIREMGLQLSGEVREFTFYWEGIDSPNNIVLIQVGVKDKK
jgi:effector-binding domain-containing protein